MVTILSSMKMGPVANAQSIQGNQERRDVFKTSVISNSTIVLKVNALIVLKESLLDQTKRVAGFHHVYIMK